MDLLTQAEQGYISVLQDSDIYKIQSENGDTTLHVLAKNVSFNHVQALLEHNLIDVLKNENGTTPLHYLATRGCKETLAHQSFDVVVNKVDKTPLQYMIYAGYSDVAKDHPNYEQRKLKVSKKICEISFEEFLNNDTITSDFEDFIDEQEKPFNIDLQLCFEEARNVIFYSLENIDTFHYESLTQRILSSEYTKAMINLGEKQCDLYQQTIDANDAKMNFFR